MTTQAPERNRIQREMDSRDWTFGGAYIQQDAHERVIPLLLDFLRKTA